MAQPIQCDLHNLAHLADVLVTRLDDGETVAACDAAYVEMCRQIVEQIDGAEREAADAEALARLGAWPEGVPAPGSPEAEAMLREPTDTDDSADPPTSAGSSGEAAVDPGPRSKHAGGRKRAEVGPSATPEASAGPAPS